MAQFLAGERILADRHNLRQAKYARRSSDGTQTIAASGDTLIAFPTAVQTDPNVTASGTGNTGFQLQPGAWIIEASIRQGVSTNGSIYICEGTPAATQVESITGQDAPSIVRLASTTVFLNAPATIYVVVFNNDNATTSTSFGKDLNHIAFIRVPGA